MNINNPVNPQSNPVRSQLYRWHIAREASFFNEKGATFVANYGGEQGEAQQADSLGLVDLSTLTRTGFKGRGAQKWVEAQGADLPGQPNQAKLQKDGSLLLSLSWEELLLISDIEQESRCVENLEDQYSLDSVVHTYLLPRRDSHSCFALTGRYAEETLSKICAIDLRLANFPDHTVVQTSLARNSAIIVRHNCGALPCFYILGDSSAAQYLWEVILDAMDEFNGKAVGFGALLNR